MIALLFTGCLDNEHMVTTWQTELQEQKRFKNKILAHTCEFIPSETTFTWTDYFATKSDQQYSTSS